MSNHCRKHKTPGEQLIIITFPCSVNICQNKAKYVDNSGVVKYCESCVPNATTYAKVKTYQHSRCTYPNCNIMASYG